MAELPAISVRQRGPRPRKRVVGVDSMNPAVFLFDLDGTLVDRVYQHVRARQADRPGPADAAEDLTDKIELESAGSGRYRGATSSVGILASRSSSPRRRR
jgi:hypothetical protein